MGDYAMLKKFSLIMIISMLSLIMVSFNKINADTNVSGHKIVIDAGHGGIDPGSDQCPGLYESTANLQIATILKDLLVADGAIVYMTRDTDTYLTNRDRYTFANATDGEILVSIHLNGSLDHSLNYTQGLYAQWQKDMTLASVLHEQLASDLGIPDGGLLQFASGVILKADMPATIQETVFISNTDECNALKAESGYRQKEIAQSIYEGIDDWFSQSYPPVSPGKNKK
jgi:N-acetylmuramoyl-L-alanine amidase